MSPRSLGTRALLLFALVIAAGFAASCGNIKIPDASLICGNGKDGGGFACPSGFHCVLPENRCHLTAQADGDTVDAKVDHAPDVASDGPSSSEGGGSSCPVLDNPTGGTVSAPDLTPGMVATYACALGGKLAGTPTRTCQDDGTWSGSAPTCSAMDCGPLTAPAKGAVSVPTTTFGSVATYSCDAGLGPSGSSTRTCQEGGWDGTEPTCVVANCPALASPTGGTVVAPTLTFGSMASYACNSGYTMAGVASRTCKPDGTWSDMAPTCTIKDCGALKAPMNGIVMTMGGTTYGASGTFTCDMGYTLSGMAAVTCGTDGAWSAVAPTCVRKDCGPPMAPAHGSVSAPVTTFGAVATNSCLTGYTLSGTVTRTCQADQTWSATVPTCVPVDCGGLSVANGSVSYSMGTTFGSMATYTCNTNYQLSGTSPVTCLASPTHWSSTPTCVDICTVAGNNGTAAHCCNDAACSGTKPSCDTSTHTCVSGGLGFVCTGPGQCASGACVSGGNGKSYCCNSACNGACDSNVCTSGGSCVHLSAGTSCGIRHLNEPNYNDIQLFCDNNGACKAPKIWCGATSSCDLTNNVCCMTSDPANLLTISCTTNQALCQCGTGGPCDAAADQRWYGCKSNADCPSNMVCSAYKNFFGNYGVVYTACFVPGTWPGGDNQFNGNTVCDSTKPSNPQCPTGNQCYGGDEVGYCAP